MRMLGAATAALALTAATLVFVAPTPAGAITATAYTAEDFKDLIEEASITSAAQHIITIGESFEWDYADPVEYSGSSTLWINGTDHTVTLADEAASFLRITGGSDVHISWLTVEGNSTPRDNAITIDGGEVELNFVNVYDVTGTAAAVDIVATDYVFIFRSTFSGNSSSGGEGGAMSIGTDSYAHIEGSTFTDNTARDGGGAVAARAYTGFYITSSTFSGNEADDHGGAIYVGDGQVASYYSIFDGNVSSGNGGAIYVTTGEYVRVHGSTFTNNEGEFGGAVWTDYFVDISGSTLAYNEAQHDGGAVWSAGGNTSRVYSSTLHANVATGYGGAVYADAAPLYVEFATFTDNSAGVNGAHLYNDGDYIYPARSIFAGSSGTAGCSSFHIVDSSGYNFSDDSTCQSGAPGDFGDGEDPDLENLADNGGATHTRMPRATSPVLNLIDAQACEEDADFGLSLYDQREVFRPDVAEANGGCDIGAVERIESVTFTIDGPQGPVVFNVEGAFVYFNDCEEVLTLADMPEGAPAGVAFPHGIFTFCVLVSGSGTTVTVHVTFPGPVNTAYKVADDWQQIPGATFVGNTLTYQVTDGGLLDADLQADGFIYDPLAAGVSAVFAG